MQYNDSNDSDCAQITAATVGLDGGSLPEAVADPAVVAFLQVRVDSVR